MNKHDPNKGLWETFHPHHEEPKKDSIWTKIFIILFVTALGAGAGLLLGAFWNPGPRHQAIERLRNTTMEDIKFRMIILGAIGGLVGAGFTIKVLFFSKD